MSNILIIFFCIFLIFLFFNELLNYNNNETFKNTKIKIYNFNTTWCGYSIKFQPIWDAFSKSLNDSDNVIAYDVKCDNNMNKELLERYYIEGYPTIIIDYGDKFIKYSGPRTVNGLRSVLNLELLNDQEIINDKNIEQPKCGNINNEKFNNIVNDDTVIYNFNTLWCGYSIRFQPIWNEFALNNTNNKNIKIIDVKCDDQRNEQLCSKYPIEGYPSVIMVKNNVVTNYNGPRTVDDLQKFIDNN